MAKTIKLPADLRDWKVTLFVGEDNGCEVYKVSRKIDKNTAQNAILRHAFVGKSNYTDEHAEYFTEEADFIESVKELDGVSNYLDVYVQDNQNKETCDLYIFTEELTSLDELMKTKTFAEDEVVDFGIQMRSLLETLEQQTESIKSADLPILRAKLTTSLILHPKCSDRKMLTIQPIFILSV